MLENIIGKLGRALGIDEASHLRFLAEHPEHATISEIAAGLVPGIRETEKKIDAVLERLNQDAELGLYPATPVYANELVRTFERMNQEVSADSLPWIKDKAVYMYNLMHDKLQSIAIKFAGLGTFNPKSRLMKDKYALPIGAAVSGAIIGLGLAFQNDQLNKLVSHYSIDNALSSISNTIASLGATNALAGTLNDAILNQGNIPEQTNNRVINEVVKTLSLESRGEGIVANSHYVYVGGKNVIYKLSIPNHDIIKKIEIGQLPHSMAITPDEKKLYVVASYPPKLCIIDTESDNIMISINLNGGGYGRTDVVSGSKYTYIMSGDKSISVLDISTDRIIKTIDLDAQSFNLCIEPGEKFVYASNGHDKEIFVIDTKSNNLLKTIHTSGTWPYSLTANPKGKYMYANGCMFQVSLNDVINDFDYNPTLTDIIVEAGGEYVYSLASDTSAQVGGKSSGLISIKDKYYNPVKLIKVNGLPVELATEPSGRFVYGFSRADSTVYVIQVREKPLEHLVNHILKGTIFDENNHPLPSAKVDLYKSGDIIPHRSTQTDAQGKFIFEFKSENEVSVEVVQQRVPFFNPGRLTISHPGLKANTTFSYTPENFIDFEVFDQEIHLSREKLYDQSLNQFFVLQKPENINPDKTPIFFVHGLGGEAGYWGYLYERFNNSGKDAWQFYYPNDQDIVRSAALLGKAVDCVLNYYNTNKINIIAHSMGTLVAGAYTIWDESKDGILDFYKDDVSKMIFIGGPRLGSEKAAQISRGELLPNVINFFLLRNRSDAPAYRDLSPGSNFLWKLNQSGFNPNIEHYFIAGVKEISILNTFGTEGSPNDGLVALVSAIPNRMYLTAIVNMDHAEEIGRKVDGDRLNYTFGTWWPLGANQKPPIFRIESLINGFLEGKKSAGSDIWLVPGYPPNADLKGVNLNVASFQAKFFYSNGNLIREPIFIFNPLGSNLTIPTLRLNRQSGVHYFYYEGDNLVYGSGLGLPANKTFDLLYNGNKIGAVSVKPLETKIMEDTTNIQQPHQPSDVNYDGNTNISDLLLLLQKIGKQQPYDAKYDINGDGKVNIFDLLALLKGLSDTSLASAPDKESLCSAIEQQINSAYNSRLISELQMSAALGDLRNIDFKDNEIAQAFSLSQNYPNPFNPNTSISYALPSGSNVSLNVYDIRGRLVRTLVDERKPAGSYNLMWDGTDELGRKVSSGVYFYRMQSGDFTQTRKMVIVK